MRSRYSVKPKRVHPAAQIPGARIERDIPGFIEPAHPTQRDKTPDGERWLHEVKVDGYRCQLHVRRGTVKAFTRSGFDWASRFASIVEAAKRLPVIDAVIDGEVIATADNGAPDFNLLQSQLAAERSERLVYVAFDLLYLDGHDLRPAALEERKARLETILAKSKSARFLYSQHICRRRSCGPCGSLQDRR